jgi:hypothetical protein
MTSGALRAQKMPLTIYSRLRMKHPPTQSVGFESIFDSF